MWPHYFSALGCGVGIKEGERNHVAALFLSSWLWSGYKGRREEPHGRTISQLLVVEWV